MQVADARVLDAQMPDAALGGDGGELLIEPLTLTRVGATVQITAAYTACAHQNECVLVSTGCDGCCQQGAVHTDLTEYYDFHFETACEGYEGGMCDCEPEPLYPACRDNRCVALHAVNDCFSPTQNLDTAYAPDARGCDCPILRQSICVGGAALFCSEYPNDATQQRWAAVEDGPCGEPTPDPECGSGERRPTAEACLAEFNTCYALASGEYCGINKLE